MKLIILGPPGAGKGSLANLLKENFGLVHLSTGDILREEMKNGTSIGEEIKKIVEDGQLVPDEIVIKLIEQKIAEDKGFMFDGFPRTRAQAEELDKIFDKLGRTIDHALYMDTDLEVVIKRLTGRRVCRNCGSLFHLTNKPPKKEGVCDVCGNHDLYQRPDDVEETIRRRMDVYLENTKPIIDYYREQGKLITLDGNKSTEELGEELEKIFNDEGKFNKNKVAS